MRTADGSSVSDEIWEASRVGFATLEESRDHKAQFAKFYWFPNAREPVALIKVFSGDVGRELHRIESAAFQALRTTGRVGVVIADSAAHRENLDATVGPCYLAKKYYPVSLAQVLRTSSALRRLDVAVQFIDIAKAFLERGWRDLDWRLENDVVDGSTVLRIDLDWALEFRDPMHQKAMVDDPRFFSAADARVLASYRTVLLEVVQSSEALEVTSLAIRLAHWVFVDENSQSALATFVGELQVPESVRAKDKPLGRGGRFLDRLSQISGRILKSDSGTAKHPGLQVGAAADSARKGDQRRLREQWMSFCRNAGMSRSGNGIGFAADELDLLSGLLFHLISNVDHGFSLADFKNSLLMLSTAMIQARARLESGPVRSASEVRVRPSGESEIFELSRFCATLDSRPAQSCPGVPALPHVPPPQMAVTVSCLARGEHWAATSKPRGRPSEDRTFVFKSDTLAVAAVVDGVSSASGHAAAEIAYIELSQWCKTVGAGDPESASKELEQLFYKVNAALIAAYKQSGKPHQAVLTVALVLFQRDGCVGLVGQAGDAQCLILKPDGITALSTKAWVTGCLGAKEKMGSADIRFHRLSLRDASGKYRIRVFSDGVGEWGTERIRAVASIDDLVNEAATWPELPDRPVGYDDWSVAGLDIAITIAFASAAEIAEVLVDAQAAAEEQSDVAVLKKVLTLQPAQFGISARCRTAWRDLLKITHHEETAVLRFFAEAIRGADCNQMTIESQRGNVAAAPRRGAESSQAPACVCRAPATADRWFAPAIIENDGSDQIVVLEHSEFREDVVVATLPYALRDFEESRVQMLKSNAARFTTVDQAREWVRDAQRHRARILPAWLGRHRLALTGVLTAAAIAIGGAAVYWHNKDRTPVESFLVVQEGAQLVIRQVSGGPRPATSTRFSGTLQPGALPRTFGSLEAAIAFVSGVSGVIAREGHDEAAQPAKNNPAEGDFAIVQAGDSLYKMAQRYGTTPRLLTELNPQIDWAKLRPKQRVRVKDSTQGNNSNR
ncbi:MAG: LysM peptidoglycan-binding domain-containing protein [Chloroflexi bacterium]|nr:LysM peptidoglycan-binding domain-containing protein [Chloroflexota bacterium]